MSNSSGSVEKLDDTDQRVVYTAPVYPWDTSSTWGSFGAYQNTLHMTQDPSSYATVIFKGVSISVNSLFSPLGGNFTATLDDQVYGPINLGVPDTSQSQIKEGFRRGNLSATAQHTLILRKVTDDPNWTSPQSNISYFNIDFISVEGTVISSPGVTAPSVTSTDTVNSNSRTPIGLISGLSVFGVLLLIGAVVGALLFVRWRRSKAVVKPKVEAYHFDAASPPAQSKSRAPTSKTKGGPHVTNQTPAKRAPSLPAEPVPLPSPERGVSTTPLVSSKSMPAIQPQLPTSETAQLSAPPMPPIPRTHSKETILPPALAPDLSSTTSTATAATSPTNNLPSTAQDSRVATSDSNTVVLRSEIEDLREQVRLLRLREATRGRDPEFQSYEPPPEYSPRRSGYQSDNEDDR